MREIKFRVWDKERKWFLNDDMFIELDGTLWDDSDFKYNTPNKEIERAKTDRYILERYTGLKDKNGKEIYEVDIVRVFQPFNVPTKAIVEFNDGCFELKGIELTWRDYVKCFVVNHAIEIIGNIHENPELLEV